MLLSRQAIFLFSHLLSLFAYCLTLEQDSQCINRDTCATSSSKSPSIYDDELYIQSRNCFCDSSCQEYGDCCNQSPGANQYQCTDFLSPTFNKKTPPFNSLSVWMRTKCLSIHVGSSADIQCRNLKQQTFLENPLLFIPVTSSQTNITYRNYFCAYCNNDVNDNIHFWEYRAFCHGNGSIFDRMILSEQEHIDYYIHNLTRGCRKTIRYPTVQGSNQPSVFIRPCKKTLPPSCPLDTPEDLARNCSRSGPAYRYDKETKVIYHNPYCAECNDQNTTGQITCFDPFLSSSLAPLGQRVYPLSILFDPDLLKRYLNIRSQSNLTTDRIYSLASSCSKADELYNLFLQKCVPTTNFHKQMIISMKCSHPILTFDSYGRFENESIYLENESIMLTKDQYVFLDDDQLIFCADAWKPSSPTRLQLPLFRSIFSIICTSISLLCLLVFIISFWLIPSLHNFPGKCLLFLSISLFIGQLTFISASDLIEHTSLCFLSGIFIHYFYLSSFFWLLIIALHIHSTFTRQMSQQDKVLRKNNFQLCAFNILVWFCTGIVILIACLIQFTRPQSSFSPSYGFPLCSISNPNAMILFFLVPIGSLLLIVAILFFKTILAIYHTHRIARLASSSSTLTNSNDHNLVFIYARLASMMGLQWFLVILALIIRQTWSWIIFEIVNSLPGLFVCFGFLFSPRVWNDIKQRISLQLIHRRQSARSNTTSTSLMSPGIPR